MVERPHTVKELHAFDAHKCMFLILMEVVDLKTILDRDADPRMKDGTNVGWPNLSS